MPSFTKQVPDLHGTGPLVEIQLAVGSIIEEVLRKDDQSVPTPAIVNAMIDTGATGTVIQDDIPAQLGLNPMVSCQSTRHHRPMLNAMNI